MKQHDIDILEQTGTQNLSEALSVLYPDYIKLKLYYLNNEKAQFETKWKMTFAAFEQFTQNNENGSSYEIEQEYYEWEAIVTELEHYTNLQNKWNSPNL